MHFDQRTQAALREVGLSTNEIEAAAEHVAASTREAAADLTAFFETTDVVYSDMDLAHGSDGPVEHDVESLDLYTHADELRGYLRFASWGVYVEGGRVLDDRVVELSLGPTVHDRVRFAGSADAL